MEVVVCLIFADCVLLITHMAGLPTRGFAKRCAQGWKLNIQYIGAKGLSFKRTCNKQRERARVEQEVEEGNAK